MGATRWVLFVLLVLAVRPRSSGAAESDSTSCSSATCFRALGCKHCYQTVGTFFILNQDEKGTRYGVRAIYRRWLSDEIGVDLAPGIVLFASEQQAPALSGQVALDMWGIIAPMCEIDMIRKDDRVEWSLLAGARGGSYLALAGGCLMGAFIIALAMDPD
jgi:hypothetical protein